MLIELLITLAILGVLRAGVVDVLVLDEGNAGAVLDLARGGDAAASALPEEVALQSRR